MDVPAYQTDLAYIHDRGYGGFARGAAPGLLDLFRQAGIEDGLVVDLGCGSGIWARKLVDAGYQVAGVDLSADMIDIAVARVPESRFTVGSFVRYPVPPCRAVTALGEVLNYLFDADHSELVLRTVCEGVFDALGAGGLLIFDVAGLDRNRSRTQGFTEGDDWTCLVEFSHADEVRVLTRRVVAFRKIGEMWRRSDETHRLQLYDPRRVTEMLESIGFEVTVVQRYGDYALGEGVHGFIARKPVP